jgi:signal peptidase I
MSSSSSGPVLRRARDAALAGGLVLLLGSAGFFLLRYRVYAIPTASMSPLITPGDRVVVDTWSQDAARGDVVLLDGENLQVKRVAAVGGEIITCCDKSYRITTAPTSAGTGPPAAGAESTVVGAGTAPFTVRVGDGRLFVLGDNPAVSLDSRAAASTPSESDGNGTVPASTVRGRVMAVNLDPLPDRAATTLTRTTVALIASAVLLTLAALLTRRRPH